MHAWWSQIGKPFLSAILLAVKNLHLYARRVALAFSQIGYSPSAALNQYTFAPSSIVPRSMSTGVKEPRDAELRGLEDE
jgi:hypothetical protein